ncbi:MAG: sugar phosphate isomerase/epimerase [Clostridia bacterium]|nr:sugar phosphate isomerase/epimerase [Clostridia bacterium]
MKKGINAWSFTDVCTNTRDMIDLAKKAGFDGFEPAFNESGELSLESTDKEIAEIKKYAEDAGFPLTSLATGLYWDYPLTDNDPAMRTKAKDIVKKQLNAAAVLGVDTILVVPGAVTPEVGYIEAHERAAEAFNELKDDAKAYGVCIGVENVWNKMLVSPLEMAKFIDDINSDYVQAYFDIGNVLLYSYPEHWIRALGKRIRKVHVKDFRTNCGNFDGFVDLLCGDVNFPAVTKALNEVGYDGYVIAEMGAYKTYTDQLIWNTSAALSRILGK